MYELVGLSGFSSLGVGFSNIFVAGDLVLSFFVSS